jgi:hypothetical protein
MIQQKRSPQLQWIIPSHRQVRAQRVEDKKPADNLPAGKTNRNQVGGRAPDQCQEHDQVLETGEHHNLIENR